MSETPMHPQQPPVPTGPTQPLPPAGTPAPTSAWTQPLPPVPGQNGATGTGRPGGVPMPWLIGGAVAFVAAVVIGVVVATSGDDGTTAAPGNPAGIPGGPGAARPEPGGKAYTKVPEGCDLLKPATVARLVPGGECTPSPVDNATLSTMITKMPHWTTRMGSGGPALNLRVDLVVSPHAKGLYDMKKKSALTALKDMRTNTGRALDGFGQEATVVHHVDKAPFDSAQAEVLVHEGNAALSVQFDYNPKETGTTQQQAEESVIAAAREVLGALS
ncbi:hypothetical protein ABZO31_26345 [Streptomyces sp. HUAS MG47]|uniref:hypothetical protein n=1 Tax=Streptomyces solicamelliae TaxID=3231716 RepID=UPI00387805A7